jgi:hypothetical protein
MDEHQHRLTPKRRRRRRSPTQPIWPDGVGELVPAVATDIDAELPIAAPVPLGSVARPWAIRLGLLRQEFTAETPGVRRMLFRESSGVLVVLALLVLAASQLPPPQAVNGGGEAVPSGSGGGVLLPNGTLDLFSATPEPTLAPGETPRPTFDLTHATLPPWCANPTCTVFVTPSPSPTPVPKATVAPTATPRPKPTPVPTATPKPTPTPSPIPQVAVPGFSCGTTGGEYAATLASVGLKAGGHYTAGDMVSSVSPAPGTMVNVGSSVKITTDSLATPCP